MRGRWHDGQWVPRCLGNAPSRVCHSPPPLPENQESQDRDHQNPTTHAADDAADRSAAFFLPRRRRLDRLRYEKNIHTTLRRYVRYVHRENPFIRRIDFNCKLTIIEPEKIKKPRVYRKCPIDNIAVIGYGPGEYSPAVRYALKFVNRVCSLAVTEKEEVEADELGAGGDGERVGEVGLEDSDAGGVRDLGDVRALLIGLGNQRYIRRVRRIELGHISLPWTAIRVGLFT
nr:hypothetical protein Iba_chr02bCG18460 [Ipomoea batatas]